MYSPPEPISPDAIPSHFDCGRKQLNRWLIRHALANELTGRSRTFVIRDLSNSRIVGFYCLSTSIVAYADATQGASQGMPPNEPIPAVLLGRLGVDLKHQNLGIGTGLLADAVRRTFRDIGRNAGVRVLNEREAGSAKRYQQPSRR